MSSKRSTISNSHMNTKMGTVPDDESFINKHVYTHQLLKRHLYGRCKQLNARIAVVGTKSSADLFLEAIDDTDIPLIGVYEHPEYQKLTFRNHPVQPIQELSRLLPEDVIIIASTAEATEIYDTFTRIASLCPCKTLHLKSLTNTFLMCADLKEPLQFQFDEFLFGRGLFTLPGENPYWHAIQPNVNLKDKVVLELGTCEGHDTVWIMSQKPKKVIALETRPLNYAKTSVTRSLYNWQNHELHLGDMHLFPSLIKEKIDVLFCTGVFYHSDKPWWLLKSCMDHCDTIVLCGHVASEFSRYPGATEEVTLDSGTYQFEIYPEFGWKDGLSGVTGESLWFKEKDLVHFLDYHGFQYKKYDSHVNETGLWISSVLTKK